MATSECDSQHGRPQTEDEIFHVLEGQLRMRAGDADVTIGAGETLLAPKGVPHTYRVESPEGRAGS